MNLANPLRPKPQSPAVSDAPTEPRYQTADVARLAGVTERQLQWWDEIGVLSPMQHNHKRLYSDNEVWVAMRLQQLTGAGIQPSRAGKYLTWKFTKVVRVKVPTLIGDVLVVPK